MVFIIRDYDFGFVYYYYYSSPHYFYFLLKNFQGSTTCFKGCKGHCINYINQVLKSMTENNTKKKDYKNVILKYKLNLYVKGIDKEKCMLMI